MNHESHIIIKCNSLKQIRDTTDIASFLAKQDGSQDTTGHRTSKTYLDPKVKISETLIERVNTIEYIMKAVPKTYCYCKLRASGSMVQCDDCMDWFHYRCANLDENFMSLEDWFCRNCQDMPTIVMDCCNTQRDDSRISMRCRGNCKRVFHPDCLGLDPDNVDPAWKCTDCCH